MNGPRSRPEVVAVVAMARNRVIGAAGHMPWRLPTDLRRYRALTMGRPMIMGRKTLQSIGKVLDGRDTIVLTRDAGFAFAEATIVHSPADAVAAARAAALARGADEIVIAGGAEVYALMLDVTDRIEMTIVDVEPAGDAAFPALDEADWERTDNGPMARGARDSADAALVTWRRRARPN